MRDGRRQPARREAPALGRARDRGGTQAAAGARGRAAVSGGPAGSCPVGFFWGDDALGIRRAVESFAWQLAGGTGPPADGPSLEVWAVEASDLGAGGATGTDAGGETTAGTAESGSEAAARSGPLGEITLRLGTAPLFDPGTLVVIREPAGLARSVAGRDRLLALAAGVAPGNGLAFTAVLETRAKEPAGLAALGAAVGHLGGVVRRIESPGPGRLGPWIDERAAELGIRMEAGAARELADRIAGPGSEGDVDRRRQTESADAELHKLSLFRPGGPITRDDVAALVPGATPASSWAFLDAVGRRDLRAAGAAAGLLLNEGTALPVVVTQLHRRLRQLLIVRALRDAGEKPPAIARAAGITGPPKTAEYRLQVLSRQAMAWEPEELTGALAGLVEVDLVSKGLPVGGKPLRRGAAEGPTALLLWLSERVARRG